MGLANQKSASDLSSKDPTWALIFFYGAEYGPIFWKKNKPDNTSSDCPVFSIQKPTFNLFFIQNVYKTS